MVSVVFGVVSCKVEWFIVVVVRYIVLNVVWFVVTVCIILYGIVEYIVMKNIYVALIFYVPFYLYHEYPSDYSSSEGERTGLI